MRELGTAGKLFLWYFAEYSLSGGYLGIVTAAIRSLKFHTLVRTLNLLFEVVLIKIAIQGRDCLVQKFRNSSVMLEHPGFRPKVTDSNEFSDGRMAKSPKDISYWQRSASWYRGYISGA